jgi:hypothetical protein
MRGLRGTEMIQETAKLDMIGAKVKQCASFCAPAFTLIYVSTRHLLLNLITLTPLSSHL